MKKKIVKKLALNKRSVANLTEKHLERLKGGTSYNTTQGSHDNSCNDVSICGCNTKKLR